MSIIHQLREALERDERTQLEVSEKTGIDQGIISRFMAGKRDLSLQNAAILCEEYGMMLTEPKGKSIRPRNRR